MESGGSTLPILRSPLRVARATQQGEHDHREYVLECDVPAVVDHLPATEQCSREQLRSDGPLSLRPAPPAIATPGLSPRAAPCRWRRPPPLRCRGSQEGPQRQPAAPMAAVGRWVGHDSAACGGLGSPPVPSAEAAEAAARAAQPVGDVVAAPLWTDFALAAMGPWRAAAGRAGPAATPSPPPRRWTTCSRPRRKSPGADDRRCSSSRSGSDRCVWRPLHPLTPQKNSPTSTRLDSADYNRRAKCTMDLDVLVEAVRERSNAAAAPVHAKRITSADDSLPERNQMTDTSHFELVSILPSENVLSHSITSNGYTQTQGLHDHHDEHMNSTRRNGSGPDERIVSGRTRIVSFQ
ncbi:hypothetical protein STCU_09919 [Strigomonas culicis]|uniref:Uncharacterized protein n=1 Tax=Strigomonas culicis TaxID=28005 RepID=S9TNZ6_9TRYP|nr:hypothetical protein STCU_09919 [Strigomonas culicis]|eukprot:EPY18429.1 hypothetical protein STCU_09919 [Strigomonas culicis]